MFGDGSFQGVSPLPNYQAPIYDLGDHRSANGIIEYGADAACGALKGDLVISNYSIGDDLTRVELTPDGRSGSRRVLVGRPRRPPSLRRVVTELSTSVSSARTGDGADADRPRLLEREGVRCRKRCSTPGVTPSAGSSMRWPGERADALRHVCWVYDPATDTWSAGPDLPGAGFENPAVVADGGKLYVFGGLTESFTGAVTNAAAFDPATGAWTPLPDLPTARGGATAEAIGGKIYVVGGIGPDGTSIASVDVFDPDAGANGTWSTAASLDSSRDSAGSAVLGGKLYVFGGAVRDAGSTVQPRLSSVEMYDPATNTWVDRAPMPTARRTMAVGTLEGRAQLIGGEVKPPTGTFPANEEYDAATDTWRTLTAMRTPRHGTAAGTIGNAIYVAGGGTSAGSSFSSVNEAFAFSLPLAPPPTQAAKRCKGRKATIIGSAGRDKLVGTRRADVIVGLGGADRIRGLGGSDRVCGGASGDLLRGGTGRDGLFGGKGPDELLGGRGLDNCVGSWGQDQRLGCERHAAT